MEWCGWILRPILLLVVNGEPTTLAIVNMLASFSAESNLMEKLQEFMLQLICGKQSWEGPTTVPESPLLHCGMLITTILLPGQISRALEDGLNLPSNNSKELPPYAEPVSTKTITLEIND